LFLLVLVPGMALACPPAPAAGECASYEANLNGWNEVRRGDDISVGLDLGGTNQTSMNFKGSSGAAGDTWMTIYPGGTSYNTVRLCVDVLTHPFNNRKGAGALFFYNAGNGKAVGVVITNAGNTDLLYIGIADKDDGTFQILKTGSLGAAIAQDAWYRLFVTGYAGGGGVNISASVYPHATPSNPDSALGTQIGVTLNHNGSNPTGIDNGDVGLIGYSKLAVIDSSATNFKVDNLGDN
jgi:hypothetical protein